MSGAMKLSQEVLTVLLFLIPGLMASMILSLLLVRKEMDTFTKTVEALIFSFVIYAIATPVVPGFPVHLISQSEGYRIALVPGPLLIDLLLAILMPIILAISANRDFHMRVLRRIGATFLRGRHNTWHEVFSDHTNYVIVTLSDGNRLFGWPEYVSRTPEEGLLYLQDPAWVKDDATYEDLDVRGIFLVKNDLIESVVFTHTSAENVQERTTTQKGKHDG